LGSSPVSRGLSNPDFNAGDSGDEFEDAGSEHSSTPLLPASHGYEAAESSESLEVTPENLADMLGSLGPGHEGIVDSKGKHQPGFQVPNDALDRNSGKLRHPLSGKPIKKQRAVAAGSTLPSGLQLDPKFPGSIPLRDKPGLLDKFRAEGLEREPKDDRMWNAAERAAARVATPVIRTALEPVRFAKRMLKSEPQGAPSSPVDTDFARRNAAMRRRQQELSRLQESDSSSEEPDDPSASGGSRVTSV
jgi:hypothetical protein